MEPLSAMRIFSRVVELGSFSATARDVGITQPTVSKTISALERELAVRLFERTTSNVATTEEGRRFYTRCKIILDSYEEAVAEARGNDGTLTGSLRISAPVGLGQLHLNRLVLNFLSSYPHIDVELVLKDDMTNLVEEEIDVSIRLGGTLPTNGIIRKIAGSARLLVASPEYLQGAKTITKPEDIADHEYIAYAGRETESGIEFSSRGKTINVIPRCRYRVNNSFALRESFLCGFGVGTAPAWLVQDLVDSNSLHRLLPNWTMASQPLHLIYPSRNYQPSRTREFVRFISEQIVRLPGFSR